MDYMMYREWFTLPETLAKLVTVMSLGKRTTHCQSLSRQQ